MTDTTPLRTSPFRVSRALLGFFYALIAHAVVLGIAVVVIRTSPKGEGFTDLANFLTVIVLGEFAIMLVSLVVSIVLMARGRKDLGTGLLIGGFLGLIAGIVIRLTA